MLISELKKGNILQGKNTEEYYIFREVQKNRGISVTSFSSGEYCFVYMHNVYYISDSIDSLLEGKTTREKIEEGVDFQVGDRYNDDNGNEILIIETCNWREIHLLNLKTNRLLGTYFSNVEELNKFLKETL